MHSKFLKYIQNLSNVQRNPEMDQEFQVSIKKELHEWTENFANPLIIPETHQEFLN